MQKLLTKPSNFAKKKTARPRLSLIVHALNFHKLMELIDGARATHIVTAESIKYNKLLCRTH